MALSRFRQTVPFKTSGYHEQPRPDANDTVHHGFGPHFSLPHYQYQDDSFNRASDFEALVPQFLFTLPYDTPLWNTRVDGLPTLGYEYPPFSNDYPASPTSSITPPPFPTTPPSLLNANRFSPEPLQNFTTSTGGFLSQENIHQERSSVHDSFSNTQDGNRIVGQITMLHDREHEYTLCFKPPSPESNLVEGVSSLVSDEMTKSRLDTPPVGSKRARTPSNPSDEPRSKRIRRDPNAPIDGFVPFPVTETSVIHPQPSTLAYPSFLPPTEEPTREFKRGNRCGHDGCGKWHTDPSIVSRHRRAHVDRYPCPNPNCRLIATTYRALKRHWENPRGGCSAYEQKREVCLVKGKVIAERFDPQIHRAYKSLKLRRGKQAD